MRGVSFTQTLSATHTPVFHVQRPVPGGTVQKQAGPAPPGARSSELPGLPGLSPGTTQMMSPCRKLWPQGTSGG